MVIINGGIQTTIGELKNIISEYKEQLKRLRVTDIDNYRICINIINSKDQEDEWEFI